METTARIAVPLAATPFDLHTMVEDHFAAPARHVMPLLWVV